MTTATKKRRTRKPPSQAAEDQGWRSNDEQHDESQTEVAENGKARQKFIDGTEPVCIPEIDRAAENFVTIRNRWQVQGEEMNAANGLLRELMAKHGLNEYRFDSQLVKIEKGKERAKVNRIKDRPSED